VGIADEHLVDYIGGQLRTLLGMIQSDRLVAQRRLRPGLFGADED
jgi:hypothetical protein